MLERCRGRENGCRVKSYSDQAGHVRNITWQDITIEDTSQCLSVNANYKPPPKHPTAFIDVSDLVFRNVQGTRCFKPPEFVCPKEAPCHNIVLDNVVLSGKEKDFKMTCEYADGTSSGKIAPKSCLH